MSIFVVGINHKTAPITLREKIYFAPDKLSLYLQDILARGVASEAVLLSTCNRSELYCEAPCSAAIYDWFCAHAPEISAAVYVYRDAEAVAHIMQVACGLDSMVIGEAQILGQMKAAFSESCTAGTVNTVFHRLFQQVFAVAKEIRTATAIGACPVSVASAAVHFARQVVTGFDQAQVAIIGAGETAELLLRYLATHLSTPITLINRSLDRAVALATTYGGRAYAFEELAYAVAPVDVVFTATGSAVPILQRDNVLPLVRDRHRPLQFIDIAVPRDVDIAVKHLPNVELFCIDDLKAIIERNRRGREHAASKARAMIQAKSERFISEHHSYAKVAHTIRAYRGQIEDICHAELCKAKQQLALGRDANCVLDEFARGFINKLMHTPTVQLRQAGQEGRFELLQFAKKLFAIPDAEVELL
jgi:glutamyl-tRNA reductase